MTKPPRTYIKRKVNRTMETNLHLFKKNNTLLDPQMIKELILEIPRTDYHFFRLTAEVCQKNQNVIAFKCVVFPEQIRNLFRNIFSVIPF